MYIDRQGWIETDRVEKIQTGLDRDRQGSIETDRIRRDR